MDHGFAAGGDAARCAIWPRNAQGALRPAGLDTGIQWLQGIRMPASHASHLERITTDPDVRFGKPCIRGHRITVQEILEWLSSGALQEQILADYPQLEPDDFLAVYAYAARLAARNKVSKG